MNSAKKLLQFDFNADEFARRALKPIEIPTERFAILEKIIKDHEGKANGPPNQETLREIYRLFIDTPPSNLRNEFNTLRRIRQLAWALTFSEDGLPRIVDIPQLKDALQLIENRFRISALRGVFEALLEAWDSPNANVLLREFVKKHLKDYDGKPKFFQKLKTNTTWYCEQNGTKQLATKLFLTNKKLSDVWTFLDLPDYMNSFPYFGFVAMEYVSIKSFPDEVFVTDVVEFVKKYNNDTISRTIMSNLIVQLGYNASEGLRQPIQSYVLQKWRDPRLAGSNWHDVSPEARKIFTKWLTEADLDFFFDIVSRACHDQKFAYRKAFWLAYFDHISFCCLVLRGNAEYLFRHDSQALQYYRDRRPATLRGGSSDQHAFIIQMGNYTFVEFSTAAACYVYYNVNLPFELGKSEYYMHELRNPDWAVHRVIHQNSENYYWQKNLAKWIKKEIGFEPVRSYRLHAQDEVRGNQNPEETEKIRINCPNKNCKQKLQIPVTENQLRITCPTCRTTFEY
ncbi:MAG: EH signature domain-containing protein [Candidatus Poribacteria bacterium]|nr:EH signature domain-containing protein [Candidatus Poribacteria bacterium]